MLDTNEQTLRAPLVSVIVPVYNTQGYLDNCVQSIINQSYNNWEALLIDDGATDLSGQICDKYSFKDARIKTIHKENGGLSSARNEALKHVKGDYIFYLDSDDFIHTSALDKLIKLALNHHSDIVECNFIRGSETIFPESESTVFSIKDFDNHTIFTSFSAKTISWGKLIRREIIGDIKFPEGLKNEDEFTTWKFYYRAKQITKTSEPLYYYTYNPSSITSKLTKQPDLKYFDAYKERIDFFKKIQDIELEMFSRIHFLKSLVLISSNSNLSIKQKHQVSQRFKENYHELIKSKIKYPYKLKILFALHDVMPFLISRIARALVK